MERSLAECTQVPWGSIVMSCQGFASIQPRQGAVEQRWAANLTPVVWCGVSLNSCPHRIPVVRGNMVRLAVDIEKYIHFFRREVRRRVHITVAETRVVVWMLSI